MKRPWAMAVLLGVFFGGTGVVPRSYGLDGEYPGMEFRRLFGETPSRAVLAGLRVDRVRAGW